MDQEYEDYKPQLRGIAQQYVHQRRDFQALREAALLIPHSRNKRLAKQRWCALALAYLKSREGRV